jgi:hypothetical protein
MKDDRRLRVFENRVLRKMLRPKKDKVTEEWRKLHNEEPTPHQILLGWSN